MEKSSDLMTAILGELNVKARFITSVKDSTRTGKPMQITLLSKFMGHIPFRLDLMMPLNSPVDTFYYSGSLASAKLSDFNSAAFPALGAKFMAGKLNSLHFKGSGNSRKIGGEFTMLYEGMEAEVSKKNYATKNKFMSWAANSVLRNGNPGRNGKNRVVVMDFDRVMYKGFPNLLWKAIQTGITNTVIPTGKKKTVVKQQTDKSENENEPDKKEEKNQKKKKRRKKKDKN